MPLVECCHFFAGASLAQEWDSQLVGVWAGGCGGGGLGEGSQVAALGNCPQVIPV